MAFEALGLAIAVIAWLLRKVCLRQSDPVTRGFFVGVANVAICVGVFLVTIRHWDLFAILALGLVSLFVFFVPFIDPKREYSTLAKIGMVIIIVACLSGGVLLTVNLLVNSGRSARAMK